MRLMEDMRPEVPIKTASVDADHVLDLRKVCKQFGTDPALHAFVDVRLVLRRGEWLSITGPSGSGKSTLLNILGCLDRPTRGKYLFDGIETTTLSENERAGLRSRRIGFIFQSFHLLPYRTVLENVMLAEVYRSHTGRGRRERAMEEIRRVGLAHRADFSPSKLSGGERQRGAVARALTGSPRVLLCDEPTGNLDSKNTEAILDFFAELNKEGMTIVVVTHDENVARRGSRRVNMKDGRLFGGTEPALPPPSRARIAPSGITMRDLVSEAIAGAIARPARMALTVLGIVIGMSALVATIGLTRTGGNRINMHFGQRTV